MLKIGAGSVGEALGGPFHVAEQKVEIGEQGFDPLPAASPQPLAGGRDPLRFALGEAGGGEGDGGEELGGGRTLAPPAVEQVELLLHREEGADLLEEGLEVLGGEILIGVALQSAPPLHQLLQQGQTLLPFLAGGGIAAEQIQHPEGRQGL